MDLKFHTIDISSTTGYGGTSKLLVEELRRRGVTLTDDASTVLNFTMPHLYHYNWNGYNVGYTPWESTELPNEWYAGLKAVDEIWSTSSWSSKIISEAIDRPVTTVHHGVDPLIEIKHGPTDNVFTFLHVGDPAVRKGGELVLEAWHKAFAKNKDVRLIYKCRAYPVGRVYDNTGSIIASPGMFDNIQLITSKYTRQQMLDLYASVHCMVYPSRGEGFGLIPFEAIASGTPTILPSQGGTGDFSSYGHPLMDISWVDSNQPEHPGKWMDFNIDEIIHNMLYCYYEYNDVKRRAIDKAGWLHTEFSMEGVGGQIVTELTK